MIIKPREMPKYLMQLEALASRLPINQIKKEDVVKQLINQRTGFNGERSINFPLIFLPQNDYFILHNLRLLYQPNYYFQIDTLILSGKFFLIIEVKNYFGTLIFESMFDQLIRVTDEKEEGFENPILQVERQSRQLKSYLSTHFFSTVPIENLVVISSPRTILKNPSNSPLISEKIIHSSKLPTKIIELENKYPNNIIATKKIMSISEKLLKEHTPDTKNILEKFHIPESDILTGVRCTKCFHLPMKRIKGGWNCPACNQISINAHFSALKDYLLLISNSITNKEARHFLHLNSDSTTKRLLKSMNLPYLGENKGRKYRLNFLENK
ncbi:nuclease [Heyndrickxia sporothermodurans]|nr:nuclease [Heyndrickxia sporothermodurans]